MITYYRIAIAAISLSQALLAHAAGPAPQSDTQSDKALLSQAKVTQAQARATALAKIPHGIVKTSELEREHGRLVWSLDVATPSRTGVTEVQIDARTGKVVILKHESAAQERRELQSERAGK